MKMIDLSKHREGLDPSMWYPPYCMVFQRGQQTDALVTRIHDPTKGYTNYRINDDIQQWLLSHVGIRGTDWDTVESSDTALFVRVYFERKSDAMLFRLTFA